MAEYTFVRGDYSDTYVEEDYDANNGSLNYAEIGYSGLGALQRFLFRCDVSSVSGVVVAANLRLRLSWVRDYGQPMIARRTAETDWNSYATWLTKDSTNPWTTLMGGDPVVVPGQTPFTPPAEGLPRSFDIDVLDIVTDAIDNRSGILGLILMLNNETPNQEYRIYTQNHPLDIVRPLLTITTVSTYTLTLSVGANGSATVAGDGVVDNLDDTYTCPADGTVYITATPDSGFQIDSVTGDVTLQPDGSYAVTMTENKTVALVFIAYWTLTLTSGGNGQTTVSPDTHPSFGTYRDGEVVTLTPVADDNYSFDSWSGADSGDVSDIGGGEYQITMDADKTIQADFAIDTCTLTVNVGANGSATVTVDEEEQVGAGPYTIDYGSLVNVAAEGDGEWPHDYYVSTASGAPVDFETTVIPTEKEAEWTMTANVTITLAFTGVHTLTVTEAGGDHGSATPLSVWGLEWFPDYKFCSSAAGEVDNSHVLVVQSDAGYMAVVTGDTATPYSVYTSSAGDTFLTATPADDLEITVTWVAIAAGQAVPRAWTRPWNDKPWGQ